MVFHLQIKISYYEQLQLILIMNSIKDKSKLTQVVIEDAPHSIREGKFRDEVERVLVDWFKNKF